MMSQEELKELKAKQAELRALYRNFPHPRNEPAAAVDALHRARELSQQIRRLLEKKDGRTLSQELEQDAL